MLIYIYIYTLLLVEIIIFTYAEFPLNRRPLAQDFPISLLSPILSSDEDVLSAAAVSDD